MAPSGVTHELSAKRRQFAGEPGFKGLVSNGRTFAIALFASLGGLVYGCKLLFFRALLLKERFVDTDLKVDNQGMFSSILTMPSFQREVSEYGS